MNGHIMQITNPRAYDGDYQAAAAYDSWPRAVCTCGWESDECATTDDARDRHHRHTETVATAKAAS